MKIFLFIALLITLSSCQSPQNNTPAEKKIQCEYTRAALDIGSGETKLKVAKVDTCKYLINVVLLESKRDVNYKGDLAKSKDGNFSDTIMKEGRQALVELKEEAMKFKPQEFTSVATAAFRDAKNAKAFVEKLNLDLNLKIQIITQEEEAILGFYAAKNKIANMNMTSSLVWDIGGGSQQMIHQDFIKNRLQYVIYEGKLASIPFKNHVIQKIQKRNTETPNPLKKNQYKSALTYAKDTALRTVKQATKNAILSGYKVYGIGGVHNYSIKGQIQKEGPYTIEDLDKIIEARLDKTDTELGSGTHVATDTTNPILVKGFMEALGIKSVEVVRVNLADGLLVNHKYWTP
jgi:exopolyphosphatase/guanosine-5'-triphosphate,3'-diphosphate pyrophosphatase